MPRQHLSSTAVCTDRIKKIVTDVHKSCKPIIKEFVEDGVVDSFKSIPAHVWYNAISSICALVIRVGEIKGNEVMQEAVVYQTMLLILREDLPIDEGTKRTLISVYETVAPTVIDVLIPGEDDLLGCCCIPGR